MGDRVVTAYVDRPTAAAYYLAFDLLLARVPLRGIAPTTPAPGLDPEIAQAEAEARDLLIRAALLEAAEHGGYRREAHLCRTEGSRRFAEVYGDAVEAGEALAIEPRHIQPVSISPAGDAAALVG